MILKKYFNKKFYLNSSIVFVIFFLDRITKKIVIDLFQGNFGQEIYLSKYININLIWNQGIAFGLMTSNDVIFYNILTTIIVLITLLVFWMMLKSENSERYGFLIIFAGSLGNIYDRLYYNAVPDFIDLHVENFYWFIFNVADIFITIGVILLIFKEFSIKKK